LRAAENHEIETEIMARECPQPSFGHLGEIGGVLGAAVAADPASVEQRLEPGTCHHDPPQITREPL
jgi:hypothetical protein